MVTPSTAWNGWCYVYPLQNFWFGAGKNDIDLIGDIHPLYIIFFSPLLVGNLISFKLD